MTPISSSSPKIIVLPTIIRQRNKRPIDDCLAKIGTSFDGRETGPVKKRYFHIHKPQIDISHILDEWVNDSLGTETLSRNIVKQEVEKFLRNPKLTGLSFLNLRLSSLPPIWEHPEFIDRLTTLDLSGNQFKTIPSTIGSLTALTTLSLANNRLKEIPSSLGNLRVLTELKLNNNQLEAIPAELGNLEQLLSWNLCSNKIEGLSLSFSRLKKLENFFLSENPIQKIPECIEGMTSLKNLSFSHSFIQKIPSFIGNLQNLQGLYLFDNPLLSGISLNTLSLPSSCLIQLVNCNLYKSTVEYLQTCCNAPDYRGPCIILNLRLIH